MPRYEYRARDAAGIPLHGAIDADTQEIASETLRDRELTVLSITEHKERVLFERDLPFFNQISARDLVIFSRQFAVLMGAKVPVVKALKSLSKEGSKPQIENRRLRIIIADVANEVESGTSLSMAMSRHPKAFSDFFANMIRSGETTGRLEEVMNYLADQMERDFDLMTKIKGAMIYPAFILSGLVVVGFVMMVFVVPKLTAVLQESGAALPWTTRLLIGTSSFFQHYAIQIVAAAVLGYVGFRFWTKTPEGRAVWDYYKLKIPVFGTLLERIYIVRFTRSMSTMIPNGIDVPTSLDICADIVGNDYWKKILHETRKQVSDGNSITTVFFAEPSIPGMIPQMLGVGEESGRLGEVFDRLSSFYARELQNSVANLVSAIEPLIMMVMGLAVGVMVAAIILPMYNLATTI